MKATLLSKTENPMKTVLDIWDASKETVPLDEILWRRVNNRTGVIQYSDADRALFLRIVDQGIPVGQNIVFNFMLEDVPISWREQAVRHRIGVHFGDNYGVDIVPEMADSAFWSQSMRIQNMGAFADDGKFYIPNFKKERFKSQKGVTLDDVQLTWAETDEATSIIYRSAMWNAQQSYKDLLDLGWEMEDARNVIPLGATHRISMTVNLNALKHIIGERGCWILQGGTWGPIIKSMVDELVIKVDPVFRRLVRPPCVNAENEFTDCVYVEENRRRASGEDSLPICPLFASSKGCEMSEKEAVVVEERISLYADLWNQPDLAKNWKWKQ